MENNELIHYGILGMKWGVRRYQNKDGSLTTAGKKKYAKEMAKLNKEKAKLEEQKKVLSNQKKVKTAFDKLEAEKAKVAAEKKALKDLKKGKKKTESPVKEDMSVEEKKAAVLKSRSAKELYKNADLFDDAELNRAYNRLNLERNISNLAPKEVSKGKQTVDKLISTGKTVAELTNTGINVWNNFAKISNAMSDPGEKKLPIIGEKQKDKKKDKDED